VLLVRGPALFVDFLWLQTYVGNIREVPGGFLFSQVILVVYVLSIYLLTVLRFVLFNVCTTLFCCV